MVVLDREFEKMIEMIETTSEETLFKNLLHNLMDYSECSTSNLGNLITVYNYFAHLWGAFDPASGNYDHFTNGIHAVKLNTENIRWLYNSVEDYRSRKVIYGLIKFWLEFDFSYKNSIVENNYDDYFDLDVLRDKISSDEVFVDCGAYTGDTAKSYFDNFDECKIMYLYDMIPANIEKAKELLADHKEIVYRIAGVGSPKQAGMMIPVSTNETTMFSMDENGNTFNPEGEKDNEEKPEVKLVTLDDDIEERITFLKMDIEGAEINALLGAKEHIIKDHPKLAICTYHHYEHLWEIPKLIKKLNSDYKFYLRYNGTIDGIMASEHVVYAV